MFEGPARLQAATALAAVALAVPVVVAVGLAVRPSGYHSELAAPSSTLTTPVAAWAPPAQLGPSADQPFVVQAVAPRAGLDPASAATDLPPVVLAAYQRAESVLAQAANGCHLSWALLAAVGYVESGNGTDGDTSYDANGVATPAIYGKALEVADTDAGRVDGDPVHDRAVGPMMFTPATWSVVGVDADGDGVRDPQDLDDASVAMGVLLCANRDLGDHQQLRKALWAVNPSPTFRAAVLHAYAGYQAAPLVPPTSGGVVQARPIAPILAPGRGHGPAAVAHAAQHAADHDHQHGAVTGTPPEQGTGASTTPVPTPHAPPSPDPAPTPTPSGTPMPADQPSASAGPSPTPAPSGSSAPSPSDTATSAASPTASPTDVPTP